MNNKQANLLVDMHEMLDTLPHDHTFDLGDWFKNSYRIGMRNRRLTEKNVVECGTSCCAVGWAILLLPSWKAAGFGFRKAKAHPAFDFSPTFKGSYVDFNENLTNALGIDFEVCTWLFFPESYSSNNDVREVMKRLVLVLDDYGWEIV